MTDDLVQVGGQLARSGAPPSGPGDLAIVPAELLSKGARGRLLVRLENVRQRDRLAAVRLTYLLIVRQVYADGRHGPRIARFDHHLDGPRSDSRYVWLPIPGIPRHPVLEPLRVLR